MRRNRLIFITLALFVVFFWCPPLALWFIFRQNSFMKTSPLQKIISYFEKKKPSFTNLGCPSLFARLAKLYFLPFLSLQEHRNNSASLEEGRQCWSIVWVLKAGSRGMELNRKAKHIRHRIQLGKGIPSKTQEEEKNNKNLVLVCVMHASGWFWFDSSGGGGGVLKSYFLPASS